MSSYQTYVPLRVTTATARAVKDTPGVLASVNINKPIQGVITILDGSTTVATLASGTGSPIGPQLLGPTSFGSLKVTMTASTEDITFLYQ